MGLGAEHRVGGAGARIADRPLLLASAALRATATGLVGVLMGVYLARLGLDAAQIGGLIAAGLTGAAAAGALTTRWGDRLGRRRLLAVFALLGSAGCAAMALAARPWALGLALFLGMLNGMGREQGASLILDQAILPATAEGHGRTLAFAHYHFLLDAGGALGAAVLSLPWLMQKATEAGALASLRLTWIVPAVLMGGAALLSLRLSAGVEAPAAPQVAPRPKSRGRLLRRVAGLFFMDAFADGLLTSSLLAYFLYLRFGISEGSLALLFFAGRAANACSHYGAAWLARRIGLVNTMVFTHLPSSLALVGLALAPSFPFAALLFLLRESLGEMDEPTRKSFLMAVVPPGERTALAGSTHLVRMAGWALAPALAGLLMRGHSLAAPLFAAAGLKVLFDGCLFLAVRGTAPPEEEGFSHA